MDNITDTGVSRQHILEQFKQWRSHQTSRREPLPAELWEAVTLFCQSYSITYVF